MNKKTKGKKRKICVLTGTRAEYGLLKPVMEAIQKQPKLELVIIATGMHLLKEFGSTYKEIEKDFHIEKKVDIGMREDTPLAIAKAAGLGTLKLAEAFAETKPDILIILGDRVETLAGAIAAAYQNICIAHIHGGDISGTIDESARHAITKFSHIHFPATRKSAERIRQLGEEKRRIFTVGAPGIDAIMHQHILPKKELEKRLGLHLRQTILVVQHPCTIYHADPGAQMQETLEAIKELGMQTVIIYPNADAGGRRMIAVIKKYQHPFIKTVPSLAHEEYLGLLQHVAVLVGNSSSGIIEAACFKLPVVNIGPRQQGRERSTNIIDVSHDRNAILKGIHKALSAAFRKQAQACTNIYGDGKAGERIAKILAEIQIDTEFLQKRLAY
ncbi:MAG: UDP-N-acetylglucosamine 2-epimerase [Nanoarchaeota archaeon]